MEYNWTFCLNSLNHRFFSLFTFIFLPNKKIMKYFFSICALLNFFLLLLSQSFALKIQDSRVQKFKNTNYHTVWCRTSLLLAACKSTVLQVLQHLFALSATSSSSNNWQLVITFLVRGRDPVQENYTVIPLTSSFFYFFSFVRYISPSLFLHFYIYV